jgi:uncharacterized protein YwgA
MITSDMVLSVLDGVGAQIKGKTMLQKIVFILSREFPEASELGELTYTKYYYGPFSRKLEEIVEDAQLRGLLKIIPTSVGDVVRHDVAITEAGRNYVKDRLPADRRFLLEKMSARARQLNAMNLSEVIEQAYGLLPRRT